jgi:hypothetical protein
MARRSRFVRLEASLARRNGVRNPRALAAWIGDRKYGRRGMAARAAASRRRGRRRRRGKR